MKVFARAQRAKNQPREPKKLGNLIKPCENEGFARAQLAKN